MTCTDEGAHEPWQPTKADAQRKEAYAQRLAKAQAQKAKLSTKERRFAPLRLLVFLAMAGLFFSAITKVASQPLWALAPIVGLASFFWVLRVHARLRDAVDRATFDTQEFEAGLARMNDAPEPSDPVFEPDDPLRGPLAHDLDLFGAHSLFDRISRAQTGAGKATLARWMTQAVSVDVIKTRQRAVAALEPQLDWRHALAAACASSASLNPEQLIAQFASSQSGSSDAHRHRGLVLALLLVCSAVLAWAALSTGPSGPRLLAVGVLVLVSSAVHRWPAIPKVPNSDRMSQRLASLRAMQKGILWIEQSTFEDPYLCALQKALGTVEGGGPSSKMLERYATIYWYLVLGRTQFLSILGFLVCWTPYFSLRLEHARRALGDKMPEILDALGAFEALSSLAGYAYEQPQDVYPSYLEDEDAPRLWVDTLRHPLLPRPRAVRNPVRCGVGSDDPQIIVVSGSNMSGKSTYLRSVGLALVLGRMGTKAPATAMSTSNWRLGSHLRSQDSLSQGLSRFGAEVARVAEIIEAARERESRPFLFLLDEVFSGTNSHDRRIAVDSLVQELIEERCVGWITTHDLALTKIADALAPRTDNQHFEDQFDEAQMAFDYRLRPGVVTKSNALALMRHAGLLRDRV